MSVKTMEQMGTPWAQEYIGTGRLTGQVAAEPQRYPNGDAAEGWRYVGDMTEEAFWTQAESEQIGSR